MNACACILALAAGQLSVAGNYEVKMELDKKDGFYRVGDEVACSVSVAGRGANRVSGQGRYTAKYEGRVVRQSTFPLDREQKISIKAEKPGWIYFGIEILDEAGKVRSGKEIFRHRMKPTIAGEVGAMVEAEKILPADERPADFDQFWADQRAALDQVPVDVKLTEVTASDEFKGKVKLFGVEVKCSGERPATGYLAHPTNAKPQSLPASVNFLSGVWQDQNPLAACAAAARGQLTLHANWHGLPVGHPKEYYEQNAGFRGEAAWVGDESRETAFLLGFYRRVMRALDYIKSRPEWNRRDLLVEGGSGGGGQAIAAAALDKEITLAVISVPSFCDFSGFKAGRGSASWAYRSGDRLERIKGSEKIQKAMSYFDGVHFAPRITCDTYVCTGFTDELCTPSSVYAFYNNIPPATKKVMTTDPYTGHYGTTRNVAGDEKVRQIVNPVTVYE